MQITIKKADSFGSSEVTLEQALSNLAHSYVLDAAPRLRNYSLGFQILESNEDKTQAVGVLGFKVGKNYIYVPVFFNNGNLKGHELMYIKNQNLFVPLKDNWVNYILNQRPQLLGEEVDRNLASHGVDQPNLYQLSNSPTKYGSYSPNSFRWANEAKSTFHNLSRSAPLEGISYYKITDFIKDAGIARAEYLLSSISKYPSIIDGIEQFYPNNEISLAIKNAGKIYLEKKSIDLSTTEPAITEDVNDLFTYSNKPKHIKSGALQIITVKEVMYGNGNDIQQDLGNVSDTEKEQLLEGKVVFKDNRPDDETTFVYETDFPKTLYNPGHSGLYDVLINQNEFAKCAIFVGPYDNKGTKPFALIVRLSDKSWLNSIVTEIWCKNEYSRSEYEQWVDKLPSVDSLEDYSYSDLCIVLNKSGNQVSVPFSISEKSAGTFKVYEVYFKSFSERNAPHSFDTNYKKFEVEPLNRLYKRPKIVVTGVDGKGFKADNESLIIPGNSKSLKLEDALCGCGVDSNPPPLMKLTSLPNFYLGIVKTAGLKKVAISNDGTFISVNQGPKLFKEEGIIHLVKDHGLREKIAREIVDRTRKFRVKEFFFKYADPYLTNSSFTVPPPPVPRMAEDFINKDVPNVTDNVLRTTINELLPNMANRSKYDVVNLPDQFHNGPPTPDSSALQLAMTAAQMGQKDVFDIGVLGSLLKSKRIDPVIDSKLTGAATRTMSDIGAAIFHSYDNEDEWKERFGDAETEDLQELMVNTFNQLGDLILSLKEKNPDSDIETSFLPDINKYGE